MVSTAGPFIAQADVLNDGNSEFYFGGPLNKSGALLVQDLYQNYAAYELPAFKEDAGYEDEGSVFIDVNKDGQADLFVSSGGGSHAPGNRENADRLYINKGAGIFQKANIENKSYVNGGKCIKGDLDQDGREDVLVAGRVYPNRYPSPAPFTFWKGKDETLIETDANSVFKDINSIGMVQDLVFEDLDGDGNKDLILCGHWMPVMVYYGQGNGSYSEAREIGQEVGWFNALKIADLNKDGKLDILVGNEGMNNKYKASKSDPLKIYLDDFDNSGTYDVILSHHEDENEIPVRGRECSSEAIPMLNQQIGSYDIFAKSDLGDIYGREALDAALQYEANEFRHGIYFQKEEDFSFEALPHAAQISPILDWHIEDFDGNGELDIMGVGNRYQTEVETVRGDAGTGLFLLQKNGAFTYLLPVESGLHIPFNSRTINVLDRGGKRSYLIGSNNGPLLMIDKK